MLCTLKFVLQPWQLTSREWVVQMMESFHYTKFQSNLPVHDKIPVSRHLSCRLAKNVVWKLNFRIGNNPPCIKKFPKFCLIFFLGKITSKSCWWRFMKNHQSNWNILLAITWVTYWVMCVIFGVFLKLASKTFSKTSWNNFQEIWLPLNEIGSSKPSYSKAGNIKRL